MDRKPVSSSNISSIGYDPESKTLEVEFKGGGIFSYHEVPQEKYDSLMNAESIGSYFQKSIRSGYKGEKV